MAEKKYALHIWFNEWYPDDPQELTDSGEWVYRKVVLRYEWWLEDRLIPFRDVLRMERREADK